MRSFNDSVKFYVQYESTAAYTGNMLFGKKIECKLILADMVNVDATLELSRMSSVTFSQLSLAAAVRLKEDSQAHSTGLGRTAPQQRVLLPVITSIKNIRTNAEVVNENERKESCFKDVAVDVARSYEGDGGGDDHPPSHVVPTGCGGCFANKGKGKRKPNLGGRGAGKLNTRDKTQNLSLKEIAEAKGPVSISFEQGDKQTLNPLGPHAAHWSNYIGEVVRSVSLYYPSWEKVSKERKAAIVSEIGTLFDLRSHMDSSRWTEIYEGINMHLQKAYNTNKASFKAKHWKADPTTWTYNVKAIWRARLEEITAAEWDKARSHKKEHLDRDPGRWLRCRDERHASDTQEYPSLIDTFWRTHTVDGVFPKDEDRRIYEEMKRLEATGEYTEDEINALAIGGKLRGHIPGVGRVLPSRATSRPSMPAPDKSLKSMHRKVYEHELKGVSNSNSKNIAFLSTEVKGSTLKQSTADPANIPKDIIICLKQGAKLLLNCAFPPMKSYVRSFAQPANYAYELMMMKTCCKLMRMLWKKLDILCRFAKYQENRANGRQEKRIVAIEDPNSKALVATDNNEDIDWTKEFDAEPFDSEHVHFGQDGLGDFDWSNIADDTPVSLALMATNSEVPYCSKCSKSYKKLLESYQTERDNFQKRTRSEILGYQMSLESLEVILKTHEKNEYAWGDKYEQMEYDLKMRDLKLEEKQKELDQVLKERDDFKVKLEKWTNASVLQNEVLNKQRYLSDKSCIGFGVDSSSSKESDNSSGDETLTEPLYENFKREKAYKAVPPPTGTIIPPRANVSFTGIDELAIRNKVLNQENTQPSQPEIDRNKVIIEDWVDSDDEETVLNSSEIQKKSVLNSENSETSFENRSPNSQNSVSQGSRNKGVGHKGGKLCYVCYSPNHLIKDCNLHERTFKQTQTYKPKGTQGSRETKPVWNNIQRVNHSNFSRNSRYPHQRRSFIPSAVLTRDGLKSTARPKMTQTVPSKSTANVIYQGTARSRIPQAVLSRSTGRPYYPRMDNRRSRISSYSPSSRKEVAVLPQHESVKKSAMITSEQTWRQKGNYLDSVNRNNGSYTLKQFEAIQKKISRIMLLLTVVALEEEESQEKELSRHHA
ncbi:hypothetical protein Tco_0579295 [Tanacetum coccineum]